MGIINETPEQVIRELRRSFADAPIVKNPLLDEDTRFVQPYKYGELVTVSVQAGSRVSSIPREIYSDFDAYSHYEVGLWVDTDRDMRYLAQIEADVNLNPQVTERGYIYSAVSFDELLKMLYAIKDVTYRADTSYKLGLRI